MTHIPYKQTYAAFDGAARTPRTFLESFIERIDVHESNIHAFASLRLDGARADADKSAKRWAAGQPLSPVDGLPVAIKDVLETVDMPTEFGSSIFRGWNGGRDSACAYALREAGAIIVGKTVTTEFCGTRPGPTLNPRDTKRTPGGSSSGSAAAVAAGMVPVAIGTQLGGSILRPAGFCGVVGFKPTFGALNRGGIGDQSSQNCIGTLSNTINDTFAIAVEIAKRVGGDPGFPALASEGLASAPRRPDVLAILETEGWCNAEPGAKRAFQHFLKKASVAGITLVDRGTSRQVELLERAIADAMEISVGIMSWEMVWPFAELEHRAGARLSAGLRESVATGRAMTNQDYAALLSRREFARDVLLSLARDVDAFITLSATGPAPVGIQSTGSAAFTVPSSMLRNPALSLPLLEVDNLPLGVQLLGFPGHDHALSRIGDWFMRRSAPPH